MNDSTDRTSRLQAKAAIRSHTPPEANTDHEDADEHEPLSTSERQANYARGIS